MLRADDEVGVEGSRGLGLGRRPVQLVEDHGDLVTYVHLKDVNLAVLDELRAERLGLEELWNRQGFCELCHKTVVIRETFVNWISIDTKSLLDLEEPKYFLPRVWNEHSPWISWEDLSAKYHRYINEKENTCSQQATSIPSP